MQRLSFKALTLPAITGLALGCSTGLQTASAGGTGSAQGISVKSDNDQSSRTNKSSDGNAAQDQATIPTNIAGNYSDGLKGSQPGGGGIFATPPQNIGGNRGTVKWPPDDQPTAAGDGQEFGTTGSIMDLGQGSDGRFVAVEPTPVEVAGTDTAVYRWTDVGSVSNLSLRCSRIYANLGPFWEGECHVVAPGGIILDLTIETTSRSWLVQVASGCNPIRSEVADAGTVTYLRITYIAPVASTCLTSMSVSLEGTSYNRQRIMLTGGFAQ